MRLCVLAAVLVAIKLVSGLEESSFSDPEESQEGDKTQQQQQGSWAHWWSYDGISGPDYWNINKRWRLCSLGRKQSPVNIRTERLVYDHLLGPIHLNWSHSAPGTAAKRPAKTEIRVRLLNSGRGLEAWLPETTQSGASGGAQLILSRGPLSYDYGLFKIELHSASSALSSSNNQAATSSGGAGGGQRTASDRLDRDAFAAAANELADEGARRKDASDWATNRRDLSAGSAEEGEDGAEQSEYLRTGKSSEHLIDGRSFDAELQLHFYNKHLASSAAEAQRLAGQDEGRPSLFAAIGVLLVADNDDDSGAGQPQAANPNKQSAVDELMLNNLGSLENQGDSLELTLSGELLERLVPDKRHYITYQGSMNRPPCSESVDWIISNRPLRVSAPKLRALFEPNRLNTNQENIRPVKPLNRRLLRTTINNLARQSASWAPGTRGQHRVGSESRLTTTTTTTTTATKASAANCSADGEAVSSEPQTTPLGKS